MDTSTTTVRHHGRETAYRRRERGEPTVCCIHGSGGSSDLWRAQFRLAADVVAVDLSGHGESDDVAASPGYEALSAYADDVVAVARETDADVLVGNSLGGAVVLHVCLSRDLDLSGVVLTGTGAKLSVLQDLLDMLESDFPAAVDWLHEPDHLFHDVEDDWLAASRSAMEETGGAVTRRDFLTCHGFDVRDDLDGVDVPALALVGEHDRLTPPRYHEYLAEHIPDCELAVIESAAHLAMLEQPTGFNTAVESFLDRLEA